MKPGTSSELGPSPRSRGLLAGSLPLFWGETFSVAVVWGFDEGQEIQRDSRVPEDPTAWLAVLALSSKGSEHLHLLELSFL